MLVLPFPDDTAARILNKKKSFFSDNMDGNEKLSLPENPPSLLLDSEKELENTENDKNDKGT